MSQNNDQDSDWSPDEPMGTETFEQGDEALDERDRMDPNFLEDLEEDPSLDPTLQVDELELEEAGANLDDPSDFEARRGHTPRRRPRDESEEGWDLDAPTTTEDDMDSTD